MRGAERIGLGQQRCALLGRHAARLVKQLGEWRAGAHRLCGGRIRHRVQQADCATCIPDLRSACTERGAWRTVCLNHSTSCVSLGAGALASSALRRASTAGVMGKRNRTACAGCGTMASSSSSVPNTSWNVYLLVSSPSVAHQCANSSGFASSGTHGVVMVGGPGARPAVALWRRRTGHVRRARVAPPRVTRALCACR